MKTACAMPAARSTRRVYRESVPLNAGQKELVEQAWTFTRTRLAWMRRSDPHRADHVEGLLSRILVRFAESYDSSCTVEQWAGNAIKIAMLWASRTDGKTDKIVSPSRKARRKISLDRVGWDSDGEPGKIDPPDRNGLQGISQFEDRDEAVKILAVAEDILDERAFTAVCLHFQGYPLRVTGECVGCHATYIGIVLQKSLQKIREHLSGSNGLN